MWTNAVYVNGWKDTALENVPIAFAMPMVACHFFSNFARSSAVSWCELSQRNTSQGKGKTIYLDHLGSLAKCKWCTCFETGWCLRLKSQPSGCCNYSTPKWWNPVLLLSFLKTVAKAKLPVPLKSGRWEASCFMQRTHPRPPQVPRHQRRQLVLLFHPWVRWQVHPWLWLSPLLSGQPSVAPCSEFLGAGGSHSKPAEAPGFSLSVWSLAGTQCDRPTRDLAWQPKRSLGCVQSWCGSHKHGS